MNGVVIAGSREFLAVGDANLIRAICILVREERRFLCRRCTKLFECCNGV